MRLWTNRWTYHLWHWGAPVLVLGAGLPAQGASLRLGDVLPSNVHYCSTKAHDG